LKSRDFRFSEEQSLAREMRMVINNHTMKEFEIGVLGGGTFGTTIAHSLSIVGNSVEFWMRGQDQCETINTKRENTKYLPGYKLGSNIHATTSLERAVKNKDIIFICIPSKSFRAVTSKLKSLVDPNTVLVSCTKGMEANTNMLMSDVLFEESGSSNIGVLSGPNLAREIMQGMPSGTVIASQKPRVIELTQMVLSSEYLRVYGNKDRDGVELSGTLKNMYAVATGLVTALGMGSNTLSLIMTRGISEISRYSISMGADPMTFIGLAGVGDLIATCTSPLSRNYRVGYQIGEGKSLKDAVESLGEVSEGVNTIHGVYQRVKSENLHMPMVVALYEILFENKEPREAIRDCMTMVQKDDVEFSAK
jgi:glycerol-3-phosphate dehydrogenase (NAD(P)+)